MALRAGKLKSFSPTGTTERLTASDSDCLTGSDRLWKRSVRAAKERTTDVGSSMVFAEDPKIRSISITKEPIANQWQPRLQRRRLLRKAPRAAIGKTSEEVGLDAVYCS